MRPSLALAAVLVASLAGTELAAARTKPTPCVPGRFLVNAPLPLVPGVSPTPDVLAYDDAGQVSLDGCGTATFASVRAAKPFTRIKAKWAACGTLTKLVLTAKVDAPECDLVMAKLKARKQRATQFTATRSACGDGQVDATGGEACDTGHACDSGMPCSGTCTCPPASTTTTSTSTSTTSTVDPCPDADGDGWTTCDGDCCDTASPSCALVNPGAFDVAGNLVDDDCNTTVDDSPAPCDGSLASNSSNATDYARAVDLCRTTTESPALAQKTWGVISAEILRADGTAGAATDSRAIRSDFGSNALPLAGSSLAILSTGSAAAPGDTNPSFVAFDPGQNAGTSTGAPADWLAANGNAFPNAPGCPAASGTSANDAVMLKLRIRVPTNARSFSVGTFFYSAEFPEWVCSPYNDVFLTLLDSTFTPGMGETANPADKNLAFFRAPSMSVYPVGVNLAFGDTGLFSQCVNGATGCSVGATVGTISTCAGTSLLIGTGFDGSAAGKCGPSSLDGGGTGWLTTSGNVTPGETIEVRFVVWDTADHVIDSLVLLDNWTWSTTVTGPGTTD